MKGIQYFSRNFFTRTVFAALERDARDLGSAPSIRRRSCLPAFPPPSDFPPLYYSGPAGWVGAKWEEARSCQRPLAVFTGLDARLVHCC